MATMTLRLPAQKIKLIRSIAGYENRTISKIGIYINKKYPQLYYFLKSNINKIRKIQDEKEYINNPCG